MMSEMEGEGESEVESGIAEVEATGEDWVTSCISLNVSVGVGATGRSSLIRETSSGS